jgi:hypothetical protein
MYWFKGQTVGINHRKFSCNHSNSRLFSLCHRGHSYSQGLIDVVNRPPTSKHHPITCPYFHFLGYVKNAYYFNVFVCLLACLLLITK